MAQEQSAPKLHIAEEVRAALAERRAVVALETTVIAHGLPWPENRALARRLHAITRAAGAVPAMIGVLGGRITVGLDEDAIERLAQGRLVRKVSRRDLGLVQARRQDGATTVAATIWAAQRAGIRVMATGGIGGVHRGAGLPPHVLREAGAAVAPHWRGRLSAALGGYSYDVSADLPELARTPVAVVCSGAKAILNLPATREWLETAGVPVLGYGTEEFPAFYTAASGLGVDECVHTPLEAAELLRAHWGLGLGGALLVVPPPAEAALEPEEVERALAQALQAAEREGMSGKALTPYLLSALGPLTGGRSLVANLALLENNARVAAELAGALAA